MTEELHESTTLLADGRNDELVARFREDGYLFFRGLVDRSTVMQVRHDVAHAIASVGWTAPGTDPMDALPGPDIRREADEHWWPGYTAVQSQESFHRLAHDPALLRPIRVLAGDDVLVHPRKICRISFPGSGFPTPPHQDFPLIQGGVDVFTLWTPFGDCTEEMGGLRLLEGSHLDGLRKPVLLAGVGGVGVQASEDDPRWRTTSWRVGDVVIFLSFTVHWAPANEADRIRLSGDYRYQAVREPVVEGSLHPHIHPPIPGWDVLAADWESREWISVPDGVQIVDIRAVDEALTAPTSRFIPA